MGNRDFCGYYRTEKQLCFLNACFLYILTREYHPRLFVLTVFRSATAIRSDKVKNSLTQVACPVAQKDF